MGRLARYVILSASLMICLAFMPSQVPAQNIDAKIKSLEQLESRIDAKLKRLDELEARLEARLARTPQPVAARAPGGGMPGGNGQVSMPTGIMTGSAAGAGSGLKMPGLGGQVSFRGGYSHLDENDTNILATTDGNDGFFVGGALDIPLLKDPWFGNTLLGQISMDFNKYDARTTGAVGPSTLGNVSVFKIAISPKYRIDTLGSIRPWIIPVGLAFAVNSPPSNAVTYLSLGGTTGAGVEYVLPVMEKHFSLGLHFSYNFFDKGGNQFDSNHFVVGPYVGINF